MAFFPRHVNTFGAELGPLFRMLDEGFADVNRQLGRHASVRAFAPRFDVNEHADSYQLHGELPGIDQKNVEIEFTDPHTLVIKGRTESNYSSYDTAVEGAPVQQGRIEEATSETSSTSKAHQPTVEDDTPAEASAETSTEVAAPSDQKDVAKPAQPKYKAWVSERSVGEFHRSFSFPSRVDQDAVKASLKDGILSIVVPKAKAPENKKITIE